jgi:hypothetical protein
MLHADKTATQARIRRATEVFCSKMRAKNKSRPVPSAAQGSPDTTPPFPAVLPNFQLCPIPDHASGFAQELWISNTRWSLNPHKPLDLTCPLIPDSPTLRQGEFSVKRDFFQQISRKKSRKTKYSRILSCFWRMIPSKKPLLGSCF